MRQAGFLVVVARLHPTVHRILGHLALPLTLTAGMEVVLRGVIALV